MKKIPTLFQREFENHKVVNILDEITPGCEEAFKYGIAMEKYDGACCAIIDGELYKRYDAKKGKTPPEGAIPCCEPDEVTGHWPHWVKCDRNNPADKWFFAARDMWDSDIEDGTYEAIGKHFQGNPYGMEKDTLIPHAPYGEDRGLDSFTELWGGSVQAFDLERTFIGVRRFLENHYLEGIVFWLNGEPVCKIKKTDFGLLWP